VIYFVNESIIKFDNVYIEICEMSEEDLAGRVRIKMSSHFIHPKKSQWNKNGITWLEEYTQDNIKSAIGMNYVVSWADEENQIPSGHGKMSFDEDGSVKFEGIVVGSVLDAYITDVEIDGQIKKVMMTEGYINSQRYSLFVKWLKEEIKNGKVHGSIEINGKGKAKNIVYLDGNKNIDGTLKMGRIPTIFDFSGLAILSGLEDPADDDSIVFEVNSKQSDLDINNKSTVKEVNILPDNLDNNKTTIEINAMNYDDISIIVESAFNIKCNENESNYSYYYVHKFYPTILTFIMKSWDKTGEYRQVTYSIENGEVLLGEIVRVEEDWKPVNGEESIEINTPIKYILNNQNKEVNDKMDEKIVLELNQKIEDKINEINSLTKSLEEKEVEINGLTEKAKGLDEKVIELNTTIVEVNKLLESEKVEKESLTVEVNAFREDKIKVDMEVKVTEVNTYFEKEISKNGFEEAEVNSLKSFVESVDLEGLKRAEAELCAKKFKEMVAKEAFVETNVKNEMFIAIKTKEKKEVAGSIPSFFN